MAERDYSGELPVKPPNDMVPWLQQQRYLKTELLIYKMGSCRDPLTEQNVRAVELLCTACKRRVYTEKVDGPACAAYASASFGFVHPETKEKLISGKCCLCPECGAEVRVTHAGSIPNGTDVDGCQPITITRIGDRLALICWQVHKHISKTGETSFFTHGYEAYVVEEKCIIRLSAYRRFMSNYSWGQWEQRKKFSDNWGLVNFVYPWNASLLKGSTAENDYVKVAEGESLDICFPELEQGINEAKTAADAAQDAADDATAEAAKRDVALCTSEADMATKNLRDGAMVLMAVSNDPIE